MARANAFTGMNHRYEYQRLNRVMKPGTAFKHLGIKRHQLDAERLRLAVKQRCAVIQQQGDKSFRERAYREMEEARGVLQEYLSTLQRKGVQLALFEMGAETHKPV